MYDHMTNINYLVYGYVYGVKCHFQQYFRYIVTISFIGGGNWSTRKKTTDLSQVTDKLYYLMLYTSPE
jgi:hypothetical protein